jgi:hypothetical protein
MNSLDKTLSELHGKLKTAKESIKKNLNHVMMIQKGNKKRKRWTPPNSKGKGKEKSSSSESSSSKLKPAPKAKPGPTSVMKRDISLGIARNTWKKKRRREVRLPIQV